jgi:nitrogen regulatory protein PII
MAEKTNNKDGLFSKVFSKLPISRGKPQQSNVQMAIKPQPPSLKLLVFIVDWNRANAISDVFVEEKVRFHFLFKGKGTARSDVLDLLGIGASEKAVVLCLEQAVLVPVVFKDVQKKFGFHNPGTGIAFTVSLSGINSPIMQVFKQSIHKNEKIALEKANRRVDMADTINHDLIVGIINFGYSDEFMNTARDAGATGGTVINARGQAHKGAVKFFGISIQDEKEIIIILTSREKKTSVMRAVCEAHGLNSQAEGIVFSLPVDEVMGINFE